MNLFLHLNQEQFISYSYTGLNQVAQRNFQNEMKWTGPIPNCFKNVYAQLGAACISEASNWSNVWSNIKSKSSESLILAFTEIQRLDRSSIQRF